MSAGSPPKTGEEWIAAFGRREAGAFAFLLSFRWHFINFEA